MKDSSYYDVIVIGAGPAGSMTAKTVAKARVNVLLIDRGQEIGVPDKCGEFIPSIEEMRLLAPDVEELESLFDPPDNCIVNRTKYVKFIFPNDVEISIPFKGVVVERKLYDKHLANEAARAGAQIAPLTRAIDLLKEESGIRIRNTRDVYDINSKIVVAADGAYSLIARKAGLPVSRNALDYGIGYQYEMVNVDSDPDCVEMYIGNDIAPGTYAWIIPKGGDVANVGTGVRTPFMKEGISILEYQRKFIEENPSSSKKLRKAVPTAIKTGVIPVGGPMRKTSTKNVVAVGDAGGHTIPTVGGGIPPALICGKIAGKIIAQNITQNKPLNYFDKAWRKQIGTTLENSLRLRRMSDVLFRNEKMIDFIAKRGWLNEEMIMKFVLCKIDTKMKIVEKTIKLTEKI